MRRRQLRLRQARCGARLDQRTGEVELLTESVVRVLVVPVLAPATMELADLGHGFSSFALWSLSLSDESPQRAPVPCIRPPGVARRSSLRYRVSSTGAMILRQWSVLLSSAALSLWRSGFYAPAVGDRLVFKAPDAQVANTVMLRCRRPTGGGSRRIAIARVRGRTVRVYCRARDHARGDLKCGNFDWPF
jgi:hypothetical protein